MSRLPQGGGMYYDPSGHIPVQSMVWPDPHSFRPELLHNYDPRFQQPPPLPPVCPMVNPFTGQINAGYLPVSQVAGAVENTPHNLPSQRVAVNSSRPASPAAATISPAAANSAATTSPAAVNPVVAATSPDPGSAARRRRRRYHAMAPVNDAIKTMREFPGRDLLDPKFKQGANNLLSQVRDMKFKLMELLPSLPADGQQMNTLIGRIQQLEGYLALYIQSSGDAATNPPLSAFPIKRAPPVIPRIHHSSQSLTQSSPSLIAFSDNS